MHSRLAQKAPFMLLVDSRYILTAAKAAVPLCDGLRLCSLKPSHKGGVPKLSCVVGTL
jgi:hypothetical protein